MRTEKVYTQGKMPVCYPLSFRQREVLSGTAIKFTEHSLLTQLMGYGTNLFQSKRVVNISSQMVHPWPLHVLIKGHSLPDMPDLGFQTVFGEIMSGQR